MRRSMIFLSLVACGLFLTTAGAFMQSDSRPQLGRPQNSQPKILQPDVLPQTYLNQNRLHKLIINDKEGDIYEQLAKADAIRNEIDYGSYKLVVVDEDAVGGRAALQAMPVAMSDEQNMIIFNGYLIDTSNPQPLSKELPADLKLSRMSEAVARGAAPGKGLYVIQFTGPIRDSWFKELEKTGGEIIAYAPHNAYVVLANERAAGELMKMKASSPFVQWMGDYQPAYKLTPGLRAARQGDASRLLRVTVQVIDNAEGELKAGELRASARQYLGERRVLKYRNLRLEIPASQLAELAMSDEVFAIEEDTKRVRLDEAQGQIVAGNLAGGAPSGPGYLAWLGGKGFNSSQFASFAINVVDDAYSLRGHPDLPDSRIAFENNPTNQFPGQGGHGFLNSHIIGGFNDGAGAAYEDANGFNYGLGIVPWARVGVTAIFGPDRSSSSPTSWEAAAYGQGARISSNSWGLLDPSTLLPITRYDVNAQEYDRIVRDALDGVPGDQQLAVVFAAGNDGSSENTVSSPGSAKNIITVGASENVRLTGTGGCGGDSLADSADDIAPFSSRGPVNPGGGDGRAKPDIVAPGTRIQAGVPQSDYGGGSVCDLYFPPGQTLYSWSSGTSHSTPAVAGGAALIYQDFLNKGIEAPSPAMVKAALMNSASYLTGAGAGDSLPSNVQGMGLMNLGRAFDDTPRLLTDQTQTLGSSGETYNVTGSVASSSQPFRITLAWTDAPGSTTGAP
jgi:Subtilase family